MFKKKIQPLLGVDITPSQVKLVELSRSGKRYQVESYAAEPLPLRAVNEDAMVVVDAVAATIKKAVQRAQTEARDVAVALGSDAVQIHVIEVPRAANLDHEIGIRAPAIAADSIKGDDKPRWDYEIIGRNAANPDMLDVQLVVTRARRVEQLQDVVAAAGLHTRIVDVERFAVENACQLLTHQLPDGGSNQSVAVVDMGRTRTTLSILQDMRVHYTRDIDIGGAQLTTAIKDNYGMSHADAELARRQGTLPGDYQRVVLEPFLINMVRQIRTALTIYTETDPNAEQAEPKAPPDRIIVCGGGAVLPGMADAFSSHVDIPTETGDLLEQMQVSPKAEGQGIRENAVSLLIACGLALRSFD